ncbi:Putative glycosyltransferase EpsE [Clostridiales bacterium CHKCI006]|nr:Putative glycosyltransferase EpsE [Clostridiales bacterium CHKCI006]
MNSKSQVRVLVLLSTYNGQEYLAAQLDSILKQKANCELHVLIRDDGSTDETRSIIKQYETQYSDRIFSTFGSNIGYIKSFFTLINLASGYDFYSLCDQDDIWLENKIADALSFLEKEDTDIPLLYASPSFLVDDQMQIYGTTQLLKKELSYYNTLIQNFLPGHEQVFNQSLLSELKKPLDYSRLYAHDSWITNVAILKGKVFFDNRPHVYYRQHRFNKIGYGKSKTDWFLERINRIRNKDNSKFSDQIDYFFEVYGNQMPEKYKNETAKYIWSKSNIFLRFKYIIHSEFYRQNEFQTFLFKLLYVLGGI